MVIGGFTTPDFDGIMMGSKGGGGSMADGGRDGVLKTELGAMIVRMCHRLHHSECLAKRQSTNRPLPIVCQPPPSR